MVTVQERIDWIVNHFDWNQHYEVVKYYRMDLVDEATDDKIIARKLLADAWNNPLTMYETGFLACIRLEGDNLYLWTTIHDSIHYEPEADAA